MTADALLLEEDIVARGDEEEECVTNHTIRRKRSTSEPTAETPPFLPADNQEDQKEPTADEPLVKHQAVDMRRAISHGGIPTSDSLLASPSMLMSLPPALCRVCERWIVAVFFEQHSELCVEIHQSEMDVTICNDSLRELKRHIQDLVESTKNDMERHRRTNPTFLTTTKYKCKCALRKTSQRWTTFLWRAHAPLRSAG